MSRTRKDAPPRIRFKREFDENGDWILYGEDKPKARKEVNTEWNWLGSTPSWWNRMMHNRPQRRKFRAWEHKIQQISDIDELEDDLPPDNSKKPHEYFW